MRLGFGSFEASLGQTMDFDDAYRRMKSELSTARIICPYPANSGKSFRESALVIMGGKKERYEISLKSDWVLKIYDLHEIVAEGHLQISPWGFQTRKPTEDERQDILDGLTPDNTAWWYQYEASTYEVNNNLRSKLGSNWQMASNAEYFAVVIATCASNGVSDHGYVLDIDSIPDCPTVPVRTGPGPGPTHRKWKATRRWRNRP